MMLLMAGCSSGADSGEGDGGKSGLTKEQIVGTYESTSFGTFHTIQFTDDGKFKSGVAGKADKEEGTWEIDGNVAVVTRYSKGDKAFEFGLIDGQLQMVKAFGKKAKQNFKRLQ